MDKKGLVWNTLGSIMWAANSFLMLVAVTNLTSVESAGSFGIAFTTAQMLYIVGLFGSSHYHMTDYNHKYSFLTYTYLRSISCLLMIAGCMIIIPVLHFKREKALYTVLLSVLMLINCIGDLSQCLFFQKNRLDYSGAALFYRTFWSLLSFCIILKFSGSITAAIWAQIITNFGLTAFYTIKATKMFPDVLDGEPKMELVSLARECLPLFIGLLLMNITINAPKYGVELTLNDTSQGYFSMLFMPVQVINLLSQFVFKPYLNQYSQILVSGNITRFKKLMLKQSCLIVGFTACCCAGAWLMGIPVLELIYGQSLAGCLPALLLIVFGGGVYATCQLMYYILVIMRRQKTILGIYVGAFFTAMISALFLIERYGVIGAAVSFLITHVLILFLYLRMIYIFLRRDDNV